MKFDALDMFLGRHASFHAEYIPGNGMILKCGGGDEVDVVLTACFGLVHFMMQNGKKSPGQLEEAKKALKASIEMVFEVYCGAEAINVVDLKEMRKQAQDAGE